VSKPIAMGPDLVLRVDLQYLHGPRDHESSSPEVGSPARRNLFTIAAATTVLIVVAGQLLRIVTTLCRMPVLIEVCRTLQSIPGLERSGLPPVELTPCL
jgi:hypothetical protein